MDEVDIVWTKALALTAAALVIVGCGIGGDPPCDVDADVIGVAAMDPMNSTGSANASLRVGQAVRVCMLGSNGCMYADQRFEFRSDAPAVVTAASDPAESISVCNELFSSYAYPCCAVAVGRLTAVGVGTAHVEAVLSRGGSVQKTAGLVWCPPMGPGSGCHPIAAVVVNP